MENELLRTRILFVTNLPTPTRALLSYNQSLNIHQSFTNNAAGSNYWH
jgi:hypothetical protein